MDNLIKFGLEERIFSVPSLMDLIYGSVVFSQGNGNGGTYQWIPTAFFKLPENDRHDIIKLVLARAKQNTNSLERYEPFHTRINCLWATLMKYGRCKQTFNYQTKAYDPGEWQPLYTMTLEVLLWHKWSLLTRAEEKSMEQWCWKKFTGENMPRSRGAALSVLKENVYDLKNVCDKLKKEVEGLKEKLAQLDRESHLGLKAAKEEVNSSLRRVFVRQFENSAALAFMLAEYDAMTGNRVLDNHQDQLAVFSFLK